MNFHGKLSKHKSWEVTALKFRGFSWSIEPIGLSIQLRLKGDHTPEFYFGLTLINTVILEFNIYDNRHEDEDAD